jgi:hypothetical protein
MLVAGMLLVMSRLFMVSPELVPAVMAIVAVTWHSGAWYAFL